MSKCYDSSYSKPSEVIIADGPREPEGVYVGYVCVCVCVCVCLWCYDSLLLLLGTLSYELIHLGQLHGRTVVDDKEGAVT